MDAISQQMATESEILGGVTIRAPAFWRLVADFNTLSKREPGLFAELVNLGAPKNLVLTNMVLQMNVNGGRAVSIFPTDNMDELAEALLAMCRCYIKNPEIHTKITLLWATLLIGSVFMSNDRLLGANKRAQEVKDLNTALYNIGATISARESGDCEIEPYITNLENKETGQYLFFGIRVKQPTIST